MEVLTKDSRRVLIRPATVDDAQGMLDYVNAVGAEQEYFMTERLAEDLEGERVWIRGHDGHLNALFVLYLDGKVIGSLVLLSRPGTKAAHVRNIGLGILKEYRGLGLGNALMEAALGFARQHDVEKLELEVFATNHRAIQLYEKYGFEREGLQRGHVKIHGRYVDNIIMGRWVNP